MISDITPISDSPGCLSFMSEQNDAIQTHKRPVHIHSMNVRGSLKMLNWFRRGIGAL